MFVFSLPRAGSTLLQRILASHEAISTTAEPWIALPMLYSRRAGGIYAEYGHAGLAQAVDDFVKALPNGEDDFRTEVRAFLYRLYHRAAVPDCQYFLDKTPRYHLVAEEMLRLFPDEKFIVLWRNPLAVAASMMETWGQGWWNLHRFKIDLCRGLDNLVNTSEKYGDRVFALRYEDLVKFPEQEIRHILDFLDLSFNPDILSQFGNVRLAGTMGDPSGVHTYDTISIDPLVKWHDAFSNPLRKWWARRYLRWLGEDRLQVMGYQMHALLEELDAIPVSSRQVLADMIHMPLGTLYCLAEPYVVREKLRSLAKWTTVVAHN